MKRRPETKAGQNEKYQNPGEKKKGQTFKSEKLTPEDAERVLSELAEREKQLQARLNKKNESGAPKKEGKSGKDW